MPFAGAVDKYSRFRRNKYSSATYLPPGAIDTKKDDIIIPCTWRSHVPNMTSEHVSTYERSFNKSTEEGNSPYPCTRINENK
jgi:hypothetical protein